MIIMLVCLVLLIYHLSDDMIFFCGRVYISILKINASDRFVLTGVMVKHSIKSPCYVFLRVL